MLSQGNGNYGTGHNCFFMSPDGTETWVSPPTHVFPRNILVEPRKNQKADA